MFKKVVQYTDFNGRQKNEELCFHLFIHDMMDIQFSDEMEQDFAKFVRESLSGDDNRKLWMIFKLLIVRSYGRLDAAGEKFDRQPEFTEELLNSPAMEAFIEWALLDSPDGTNGKAFYEGIMPKRLQNGSLLATAPGKDGRTIDQLSTLELEALLASKRPANQ